MSAIERAKPPGCTCQYPRVILRNMNGHDPSCPVYQEWARRWQAAEDANPQTYSNHRILVAFDVLAASREDAERILEAEIDHQFHGTRTVAYVGFEAAGGRADQALRWGRGRPQRRRGW